MITFLKRWWWFILLLLILIPIGGFLVWTMGAAEPMPQAIAALNSDTNIEVTTKPWLTFYPTSEALPQTGFIFYPGGLVDARAYAPFARNIAEAGYLVVIVPMPLNLAVFAPDSGLEVVAQYDEIERWAIGGHSLGGSIAAQFALTYPDIIDGVAFWASYPATSSDLSATDLAVVTIYGTEDGLATVADIDAARSLLPESARWLAIEGGNHAQFGWYGEQSGDNPATISHEAQQAQTVAETITLLMLLDQ